jgi:hypothetical protein
MDISYTTAGVSLTNALTEGGATLFDHIEYSVTVDPSTDVITTATAHDFQDGDLVFFTAAVLPTGLAANTRYWVRDRTSTTFKVSASVSPLDIMGGTVGSAVNITSAGTTVVALSNNGVKRNGNYVHGRGNNQTASVGTYGRSIGINGNNNTVYWLGLPDDYEHKNANTPSWIIGNENVISGNTQGAFFVMGTRMNIAPPTTGVAIMLGTEHYGAAEYGCFFGGGYHNEMRVNGKGPGDSGTALTGSGGLGISVYGAGAFAYMCGAQHYVAHANKDMVTINGTLTRSTADSGGGGVIANTSIRTDELTCMRYYSGSQFKWLHLRPNKIYQIEFKFVVTLEGATTPTYMTGKRIATYLTGAAGVAPTLIGTLETIGTDRGSNAGAFPTDWAFAVSTDTTGLHVNVTIRNNDGASRNYNAICHYHLVETDIT